MRVDTTILTQQFLTEGKRVDGNTPAAKLDGPVCWVAVLQLADQDEEGGDSVGHVWSNCREGDERVKCSAGGDVD